MKNNNIEFRSHYSFIVFKLEINENNKYEFKIHLFYNNKFVMGVMFVGSIYFEEFLEIDVKTLIFSNDKNSTELLYITQNQYWEIRNF